MTSRDETLLLLEGGRDVETNVSEEVENKSHRKKKKPLIIVGGIIGLCLVLCGCFFLWWVFTREDKPGIRKLEKPVQGNLQGNSSGSNPPGSNDLSHTNATRESPEPTEVDLPASPVNTATHPLTGLTEPFNQEKFCTREDIPDLRKEECKLSTLNQRGLEEKYTEQRMKNAKNWEEYCDNVVCDYVINRTKGRLLSGKNVLKGVKTVVNGYLVARTAASADPADFNLVNEKFFYLLLKKTVDKDKRKALFQGLVANLERSRSASEVLELFKALDIPRVVDPTQVEVTTYIGKLGTTNPLNESLLLAFVGHMYLKVEADKLNPSDTTLWEDLVSFRDYLDSCKVDVDTPNRLKLCHRMLEEANAAYAATGPKKKNATLSWVDVTKRADKLSSAYRQQWFKQCNKNSGERKRFNSFCRAHLKFYTYSELEKKFEFVSGLYEKRRTWVSRCIEIGIETVDSAVIDAKFPPRLGYYNYPDGKLVAPNADGAFSKCERLFQQPFDGKKVQEAYEEIELTAFMLVAEKKFKASALASALASRSPLDPTHINASLANVDKRNEILLAEVRLDFLWHCNAGKNYEEKSFETDSGVSSTHCGDHLAELNRHFQVNEKNYSKMRPMLVTALNAVYHV